MKPKNFFYPFLLFASIWWIWGESVPELVVHGELPVQTSRLLEARGVRIDRTDSILRISLSDREAVFGALSRSLHFNYLEELVAGQNIENVHTLLTPEGEPYRRRFLVYGEDGELLGLGRDPSDFNWTYDPLHPASAVEGPKRGYLARPNVNPRQERGRLEQLWAERVFLKRALRKLEPEMLFSEGSATLAELELLEVGSGEPGSPFSDTAGRTTGEFQIRYGAVQRTENDAGQAAVATALNWISGLELDSADIDARYGFGLLDALREESKRYGITWSDAGNLSEKHWTRIERCLNDRHLPVILALNGDLSPSTRGHIVVLTKIHGERVRYYDPALGANREAEKGTLLSAPPHPHGNFVFLPSRASGG